MKKFSYYDWFEFVAKAQDLGEITGAVECALSHNGLSDAEIDYGIDAGLFDA